MRILNCKDCGRTVLRTGPGQRYCPDCSRSHDLQRKRRWAKEHPPGREALCELAQQTAARTEMAREAGAAANRTAARIITWFEPDAPGLVWLGRISLPFSYAVSKNHIYTLRQAGHLALRREAKQMRWAIAMGFRRLLATQKVARNKLWLDILVQKPDHRGDAVNVLDLVCDAVKDAVGLDDRWFCVRGLDWEIVKHDPRLIIGVGQESEEDCQVCSYCGQIKPLGEFGRRRNSKTGVGRECFACRRAGRVLARNGATDSHGGE